MIVTTTPTVMDGQVLRWYLTLDDAEHGDEIVSASRNRVEVYGIPDEVEPVLADARRARERMADGEDVTDMATHRTQLFGPPEPLVRVVDGGVPTRG